MDPQKENQILKNCPGCGLLGLYFKELDGSDIHHIKVGLKLG